MITTPESVPQDFGWRPHKPETWTYHYADLKEPLTMKHFLGWERGEAKMQKVPLAAGHRVRIVMVSRFGDVGITEDLDSENGYGARVSIDSLCSFGVNP